MENGKVTWKDKEAEMIREKCDGIASRAKEFQTALKLGDERTLALMFMHEQLEHFKTLSDVVVDMDAKLILIEQAVVMEATIASVEGL
jgi:hypothetical protein